MTQRTTIFWRATYVRADGSEFHAAYANETLLADRTRRMLRTGTYTKAIVTKVRRTGDWDESVVESRVVEASEVL